MIGRFYYFPIRNNNVVIDTCGDDNSSLDDFKPICIGYLYMQKRKLNYVELASKTFALLFKNKTDYERAIQTLTQLHEVYSNEEGLEMSNVYFAFDATDIDLNIYGIDLEINDNCLDEWKVDFRTRDTLVIELERMCDKYGMS